MTETLTSLADFAEARNRKEEYRLVEKRRQLARERAETRTALHGFRRNLAEVKDAMALVEGRVWREVTTAVSPETGKPKYGNDKLREAAVREILASGAPGYTYSVPGVEKAYTYPELKKQAHDFEAEILDLECALYIIDREMENIAYVLRWTDLAPHNGTRHRGDESGNE